MSLFNLREMQLAQKIRKASQAYYSNGTSEYSDEEFDDMLRELRAIDPDNPLLTSTGHGYDVENVSGVKVKHKYGTAGSLGKAYAFNEIPSSIMYANKVQISLKLDGLSIVLYYRDGKLDRALTRGNGEIGIDKTDRISLIVPTELFDSQFSGGIRGELIFNETNWVKYREMHPEAKNPRNSAAGMINADNFSPEEFKLLNFVAYTVVGTDWDVPNPINFYKLEDVERFLHNNMPHVVPSAYTNFNINTISIIPEILKSTMDKWVNESKYRADGVVIKQNNILLKEHSNYIEYDYDAIAFKFESEIKETTVLDVEWNLSKNNNLIPTVIVEPTELSGTTVRRATGYNAAYICDNKVGVGAKVKITKCGEIIPNIVKVTKPAENTPMPFYCPACDEILVWDGVNLKCTNELCGNARMQDIIIWCKNLAPMDGFKDSLIEHFVNEQFGEGADVETIMTSASELAPTTSVQRNMYIEMMNTLHSSKPIDIKDALLALNIHRLGKISCGKLASNPSLCQRLIQGIVNEGIITEDVDKELRSLLGEATTNCIHYDLRKLRRLQFIWHRIQYPDVSEIKGEVVITGKLSMPRNKFEKLLNEYGYKLSNTINSNTICLITDDPNGNSTKNKKANEMGIPKLSEIQFKTKYM